MIHAKLSPTRLLAMAALALAASCASTSPISITTEPMGAMVQIDGRNIGAAPASYTLDFDGQPTAVISAVLEGYFPEQVLVTEDSPLIRDGHLRLVMMEDEAWKVTTTSEATNNWMRVQVDDSIATDDVWQKLIDSVTSRYASLEQLDSSSGYVRTVAEIRRFRGPKGTYRVRTQFLCSMSSREPLIYKFKIQADVTDRSGDWVPYERVFKEDASLIEELRDRLGMK